jgi:hypothetical protein
MFGVDGEKMYLIKRLKPTRRCRWASVTLYGSLVLPSAYFFGEAIIFQTAETVV